MQVRAARTKKELIAMGYSTIDNAFTSKALICIYTHCGSDIDILPLVPCHLDIDGTVYFHNGTEGSYDMLRNKLEMLFAIELL